MFTETSFNDWYAQVKTEFTKAGLVLPDDIEMMELAHMECIEEKKSVADFVAESKAEQNG